MSNPDVLVTDPSVVTALPPLVMFTSRVKRLQARYDELGGDAVLGAVTAKDGAVWSTANGWHLCDNDALHQVFEVHGAIAVKWLALGGPAFGLPTTDELPCPDGVGRFNHFADGTASIYWTPKTGAAAIWGDIRKKWASIGWERSVLGYPVTDETPCPDGRGRFNHFANGGSIYWTPKTGAHTIYGDIRTRWQAMGWERSYLGYPVSDEVDFAEGGRANEFEHGGIYWWRDTGAIDLRDVVVHYTGLHCFGETDWDQSSDSDEPYVIIGVSSPKTSATLVTQVYDDVDAKESRPDLLELYRGRPYGLALSAVLMEQDFGDPNKYRAEVQAVVDKAHEAGVVALGLIPVVGPAIAAIAGPALGSLMPAIGGAINDLFDWGDDRIGSANVTISAKQLVLLATRQQNSTFDGIGYKVESPLISGSGASYKVYFGVVPA